MFSFEVATTNGLCMAPRVGTPALSFGGGVRSPHSSLHWCPANVWVRQRKMNSLSLDDPIKAHLEKP